MVFVSSPESVIREVKCRLEGNACRYCNSHGRGKGMIGPEIAWRRIHSASISCRRWTVKGYAKLLRFAHPEQKRDCFQYWKRSLHLCSYVKWRHMPPRDLECTPCRHPCTAESPWNRLHHIQRKPQNRCGPHACTLYVINLPPRLRKPSREVLCRSESLLG